MDKLQFRDLGLIDFDQFLLIQDEAWKERCEKKIADTILFAEHPTCISLGAQPQEQQLPFLRVLLSDLHRRNIKIHKTLRGGSITIHTPGILGCYFVMRTAQGVWRTVNLLKELTQRVFVECSLQTTPLPANNNTPDSSRYHGAWTKNGKIASIGIRMSRNVTRFGININVNPDPNALFLVHPCGITNHTFTSLAEEGHNVSVKTIREIVEDTCKRFF